MIRFGLWLLGGVLLGGIVHLVTVLALPTLATQDAYDRLSTLSPVNKMTPLVAASPETAPMPFMDPAFTAAVCRYDLRSGPLKFSVPVSPTYTAVSFYTRTNVAYYAINDRAAGKRVIELELMTMQQHDDLPDDEEITSADRLIVESPTDTGLILIKALVAEPGLLPAVRERLSLARCEPAT